MTAPKQPEVHGLNPKVEPQVKEDGNPQHAFKRLKEVTWKTSRHWTQIQASDTCIGICPSFLAISSCSCYGDTNALLLEDTSDPYCSMARCFFIDDLSA